jgi:hypothetical protein
MDGGVSVRDEANYAYSKCAYIKVHVRFKVATSIHGSALPQGETDGKAHLVGIVRASVDHITFPSKS